MSFRKLTNTHTKQRWAASLRHALIKMNAPGNDVFESYDPDGERQRFDDAVEYLDSLTVRAKNYKVDLSEFLSRVEEMTRKELEILELFRRNPIDPQTRHLPKELLEQASVAMAQMDRHQAAALTDLIELDQHFLMRVDRILTDFGVLLIARASVEKYLLATVVLILIGIFWYGRQLQRMHEQMVLEQQRTATARHQRLASVGEVCTAVAHGIRNPLAAISSSAQLGISSGSADEQTRGRLDDILTECKRLDLRIKRLLEFASGSARPFETFDARETIDQAVREMEARIDQCEVQVTTDQPEQPLVVNGDRERMVQAIIEIIANALAFVSRQGTINIRSHLSEDRPPRVVIDVIDDGPGIPEPARARVFDLFFTTRAEGTGIGLASVKHTVQIHGGETLIMPTDGTGAHVRILLPIV